MTEEARPTPVEPEARCDRIVNNGFGEPTECGRTMPCEYHDTTACGEWFGGQYAHDYCGLPKGHDGKHRSPIGEARPTPVEPEARLHEDYIDGQALVNQAVSVSTYDPKWGRDVISIESLRAIFTEMKSESPRLAVEPDGLPLDVCPDCGLTAQRIGEIHITAQRARLGAPSEDEPWTGYFSPDDDVDGGHSER